MFDGLNDDLIYACPRDGSLLSPIDGFLLILDPCFARPFVLFVHSLARSPDNPFVFPSPSLRAIDAVLVHVDVVVLGFAAAVAVVVAVAAVDAAAAAAVVAVAVAVVAVAVVAAAAAVLAAVVLAAAAAAVAVAAADGAAMLR